MYQPFFIPHTTSGFLFNFRAVINMEYWGRHRVFVGFWNSRPLTYIRNVNEFFDLIWKFTYIDSGTVVLNYDTGTSVSTGEIYFSRAVQSLKNKSQINKVFFNK